MSLTTVVMFVVGYLVVLLIVLGMLIAAKRADARARAEHDALVRSMTADLGVRARTGHDPDRTLVSLRRTS